MELRKVSSGKVHLAVGLPLSWMSEQKDSFKDYLLQNVEVKFSFRGKEYQVECADCNVYPQGFSAIYSRMYQFSGVNILADIGNGTMNIMYINDRVPVQEKCFTEKFGVYQCILAIRENFLKTHGIILQESQIEGILRSSTADIDEKYLKTVCDTATDYVGGIFRRLREREYNPDLMRLYVVGGGSCQVKNFGDFQASRVNIIASWIKFDLVKLSNNSKAVVCINNDFVIIYDSIVLNSQVDCDFLKKITEIESYAFNQKD